jgi:hypothetical protein
MGAAGAVDVGKMDVGEDVRGAVSVGGVVVRSSIGGVGKVDVAGWACCADIMIPLHSWEVGP